MTLEDRVKAQLGELVFAQLAAQQRIEDLEQQLADATASPDPPPAAVKDKGGLG